MKTLLIMLWTLFSAPISAAPDWVEGLLSGEERMRLRNGSSILFRRLAQTCEKATKLVEEDIEREFDNLAKYKMELIYEDKGQDFCAVTASVDDKVKVLETPSRSAKAKQYAIFGLSYAEFKQLTKDSSPILVANETGLCFKHFESKQVSIYGNTAICWIQNVIAGYCDVITDECKTKFN